MTKQEIIKLLLQYKEWEDDLDETACQTGWVTCPLCDGGGWIGDKRKSVQPKHKDDCPRQKFNESIK